MDKQACPFVSAYAFWDEQGAHFLLPGREITLQGGDAVLLTLLRKCTGYQTLGEVISLVAHETGYGEEELLGLVEELVAKQILVDATQYYLLFHTVSASPMPFRHQLSEEEVIRMLAEGESFLVQPFSQAKTFFEELLERRESTREFTGEPLSQHELQQLAWSIYGKTTRRSDYFLKSSIGLGTVPSGGALYPLRLFVLTPSRRRRKWECFRAGPEGQTRITAAPHEALVHAFLGDSSLLDGAAAAYVLACDFLQITQKYANRGYRYALLEAGHAAQNAYLWCTEQGIGIVEVGGFDDEALSRILSLSYPNQAPLTILLVGRRTRDDSNAS